MLWAPSCREVLAERLVAHRVAAVLTGPPGARLEPSRGRLGPEALVKIRSTSADDLLWLFVNSEHKQNTVAIALVPTVIQCVTHCDTDSP